MLQSFLDHSVGLGGEELVQIGADPSAVVMVRSIITGDLCKLCFIATQPIANRLELITEVANPTNRV